MYVYVCVCIGMCVCVWMYVCYIYIWYPRDIPIIPPCLLVKSQCLRVIQSIHYIKPSIHCRNSESKISTSPGGSSSLWVSTTFGTLKALSYSWEVLRHASGTSQENSHMYVYPHLPSMSSLVQIDKRRRIFQDAGIYF